jgi:glycerate 2-kinase
MNSEKKIRSDVMRAFKAAIAAASPETILRRKLKLKDEILSIDNLKLNLSKYDRVLVIGAGKATALMALELERILGDRITSGVVNIPDYQKHVSKLKRIRFEKASHPIPSKGGELGVRKMIELVGKTTNRDLVICLISGGGSALMPMPLDDLQLSDERRVTDLLLKSGAEINEINTVRKHLSAIKGGRLAALLYPARVVSLIISDVVGDRLDSIASGPTTPDTTTYSDAKDILTKYALWNKIPNRVRGALELGAKGNVEDTPKPGSRIFLNVTNVLVATNKQSCLAAARSLEKSGYKTIILSTHVQGEAREIGNFYAGILKDVQENKYPQSPPMALVAGGETTVTVNNGGLGGRNQELVLSALIGIAGLKNTVIASIGTDGVDGPTNAAGAIADGSSLERGVRARMDAHSCLGKHDSYRFFAKLGDLIETGPTGTNVNDIAILAAK